MRSLYFKITFFVLLGLSLTAHPTFSQTPSVENVSFWTSQLSNPDEVAIQPQDIRRFNDEIQKIVPQVVDVFDLKSLPTDEALQNSFTSTLSGYEEGTFYDPSGKIRPFIFYEKIKQEMVQSVAPSEGKKWALTVRRTSMRDLPTSEALLQEPDDLAFDQLQATSLEVGEPVVIVRVSRSRSWVYVQSVFYSGWIPAVDLAATNDVSRVKGYVQSPQCGVVLGARVSVFGDALLQNVMVEMGMGTRLSGLVKKANVWQIRVPQRTANGELVFEKGYLSHQADIAPHFLPLTQRNVLTQAFKLLGMPYGWGGSWNGDDCSGFMVKIFRSFGIQLPRNSSQQAKIGHIWSEFEVKTKKEFKKALLGRVPQTLTFLVLRGHIMLYLGRVEKEDYAIHATWSLAESHWFRETKHPIGRVVVSRLEDGKGTKRGSYLDRLISLNSISL
jgi:hypothetical protein